MAERKNIIIQTDSRALEVFIQIKATIVMKKKGLLIQDVLQASDISFRSKIKDAEITNVSIQEWNFTKFAL